MSNFTGDFYDADYFERGRQTGKSWYENYHWMPRRSFKEALAFADMLNLGDSSHVLDFGCGKGFLVRALRELYISSDGCDISEYSLSFAPKGCWNCETDQSWRDHIDYYTSILAKDVFEHLHPKQLWETLCKLTWLAPKMMCVVPMGDHGKYRIPEYHKDVSHVIAEDESWWDAAFYSSGWRVVFGTNRVVGIKDNWAEYKYGNHIFILEKR